MEHVDFVMLVARMRTAQTAYFRQRSTHNLERAKQLEREVDEQLKGYSEGQGKLFEGDDGRTSH